jgi:hypothetical protein
MSELIKQLREWRASITAFERSLPRWWTRVLAGTVIVIGILLPFLF